MAGRTRVPAAASSPETSTLVLEAVRSATAPVTTAELRRRLGPSCSLPPKSLAAILEGAAAAGSVFRVAPGSPRGQPRYWDRDPRAVMHAAIVEVIDRVEVSFTAKELLGRLKLPLKVTEAEVTDVLASRVSGGLLHELPPVAPGKKTRYGKSDAIEFGRQAVHDSLQAKGPSAFASLRRAAKWLDDDQFRQVIEGGLASGKLWRHPSLTPGGKELLGTAPPSPEPYLKKVGAELGKVIARCLGADMPQDVLRRALMRMLDATGISLAGAAAMSATQVERQPAPGGMVDLIALMRRIEPGADRGALVGARDLRRAAQLDKEDFDQAVLELARQGRFSLHRHDYVASLAPEEQDDLVTDGHGNYYVGVALRRSSG